MPEMASMGRTCCCACEAIHLAALRPKVADGLRAPRGGTVQSNHYQGQANYEVGSCAWEGGKVTCSGVAMEWPLPPYVASELPRLHRSADRPLRRSWAERIARDLPPLSKSNVARYRPCERLLR